MQHARPQRKRVGVDLVQLIEVGEDDPVLGQCVIGSRDRKVGRDVIAVEAGIVVDLIGAGHKEQALAVTGNRRRVTHERRGDEKVQPSPFT